MDSKKQSKGKSASSSVTNIAIRFHADDEELEQVVQHNDDTNHQTETSNKQDSAEDDLNALSSSQLSTPTSSQSDIIGTSTSTSVLGRLGKRSASLESSTPSETSSGDAWRLFREVRGRITKTVEEKIEEIKSDRLKNSKNKQKHKLGTKVEHSSISDSEDLSESSCSLKVSDNSLVISSEKKDCDNNAKKNDNQQSDSGRSTPLICSSSSEKDDLPNMDNLQNGRTDEEKKKDKNESNDNKNEKKKDRLSFCEEEKPLLEGKEKLEDDSSCKKEKKVRRFHFRDRFQGSPDKKKNEISIKFSSLKDVESDEEKECVNVEYGQEASEMIIEPANIPKVPVVETPVAPISILSKTTNLLWAWRCTIFIALLAIVHYLWPANYMLGFFVGAFITIQVTSAINWVQESFQLRQSPSVQDFTEGNSIYDSLTYPIFASSRYFTPHDNPEKIVYEGWMNEFSQQYSPGSYHISLTETVQIKLEGSLLTLSNPSTKIPKRAQCNEPEHKKLFNRQRLFDIAGCKVQLLPVGLTHKRIWSKKYPVCITLLKMSKLGVRYRTKGKITIDDDQPWLDPEVDAQTPVEINDPQEIFAMDPLEPNGICENKSDDKISDYDKSQDKEETSFCIEDPLKEHAKLSGTGNDSANEEDDDDEDFVRISPSLLNEFCLHLFARCDREKEIWFRRIVAAAGYQNDSPTVKEKESSGIVIDAETTADKEKQQNTSEGVEEKLEPSPSAVRYNMEQQYLDYMNRLGQKKVPKLPSKEKENSTKQTASPKSASHSVSTTASPSSSFTSEDLYSISEEVMWVNAFAGRLLYDVFRDSFWLSKIQEKFQRKLSAIKLPYFMEELVISHIDFGETVPLIQRASRPVLNENGIWADLDIIYDGNFRVTIDTKLNLMKLKKAQATLDEAESASLLSVSNSNVSVPSISPTSDVYQGSPSDTIQKSAIFDSDVEDSAESSSEEFDVGKTGPITLPDVTPSSPGNTASHKMLRMVDKIAASKYFQQVTEYKYIKRAMEGVSNTNIALVVEVRGLIGTLVLNFPPPPSDRLWYGFRSNPQLLLTAQPKVGDRTISLLHISTWIERRLRREFQKLLVLPNMDDLIIPVMNKERPC